MHSRDAMRKKWDNIPMTDDRDRVPPNQKLVTSFPVLHVGPIPEFDQAKWDFRIFGLVENEVTLTHDTFASLPQSKVVADFHCVTGWSQLDNIWEGVSSDEIIKLARPQPEANFVMIHCEGGYTTNIPMESFADDGVIFANTWNEKRLTPEHGFPLRLVVPKLYAWKSAKWVRGVEFMAENMRGYWEKYGYHINGDPWKEERFSSQE